MTNEEECVAKSRNRDRGLIWGCAVLIALTAHAWAADDDHLEDCVGATPDATFQSDHFQDYRITHKNKFNTVESGVSDSGGKVVLTSTRCTRAIQSFAFEFPKGHKLQDAAYWARQGAEALRKLKVKPTARKINARAVAALKKQAADRTPAALSSNGKRWEKPIDITIQENYESVHLSAEQRGAKVVLTVVHDTAM
jgi:hypothetical protein